MQLDPNMRGWLQQLADLGNFGTNPTEVIRYFLQQAITKELRADGLIRNPPPMPKISEGKKSDAKHTKQGK